MCYLLKIRTVGSRHHIERIRFKSIKHGEVSEVVGSSHEEHHVGQKDDDEKSEELLVVAPVVG